MSDYRRNYVAGGTYFFTVVTYCRRLFLVQDVARACLHEALAKIQAKLPFEIVAIVLLPDHWHAVVILPPGDANYSLRLRQIKEEFTRRYLQCGGTELRPGRSRLERGERGIWQRRFWEHTIEGDDDLTSCVDYVHWNPKKHGLVANVKDWSWSSFHRFVERGEYESDWGREDPTPDFDAAEWE